MKIIRVRVSYHHGDAEQGRLDLYDAGRSTEGLARAMAISTHALLNDGAVRRHGDRAEGAQFYIEPAQRGSFVEFVTVVLSNPAAQGLGISVAGAAFWDMIKYGWNNSVGRPQEPETPFVRNLAERRQELAEELAASLESPLEQFHRPIRSQNQMEIQLARPRVGEIIRLDNNSRTYVSTRERGDLIRGLVGNVTRYNILSGFGRFYVDESEETMPFNLADDFPVGEVHLISRSLDEANRGLGGKILFDAIPIVNARGETRRYLIKSAREIEEPED